MFAPPSYYTLSREAIVDWYERFAKSVDIGIMLYEQGFRGPVVNSGMNADLVGRLLDIPSVVAIKHVGIFALVDEFTIIDRYHDRLAYIDSSGGYATTAAHMHGAAGWVTEIAPIWPEFEMKYWELLEAGDYKAAQLHRHRLAPLFQFVMDHPSTTTAYSWITVLKAALEYVGLEGGPVRPPFRALNASEKGEVFDLLAKTRCAQGRLTRGPVAPAHLQWPGHGIDLCDRRDRRFARLGRAAYRQLRAWRLHGARSLRGLRRQCPARTEPRHRGAGRHRRYERLRRGRASSLS